MSEASIDQSMPCPICRETIKVGALKCRFCNSDLRAVTDAQDAESEHILYSGHPAVIYSAWQWLAVFCTLGIAYVYYWLESIAVTFHITTQRIKIERGVLSKLLESVELFTIEHFDVYKPLGMRLAGYSSVRLRSSDASSPVISIYGIDGLEKLADELRECSLRERARRKITSIIQP
ncbi:PH domain-containing protein [Undibacterium sp. TS12]|uniref:PH domain-containing protein n=1 Tax=Undibacterium sp. TS12 TaxID=2908202 RepID=UPI001F4C6C2B|nr:PH domain-containing protein [Undibacterium sp. TS12]MCH8621283.1 PH domain-containing protein [Undibacterium sp. TS12]